MTLDQQSFDQREETSYSTLNQTDPEYPLAFQTESKAQMQQSFVLVYIDKRNLSVSNF